MTTFISHRINDSSSLKLTDRRFGVEIDLRDFGNDIVMSHDPFTINAEKFENYLTNYDHRTMILNIKSERIEHKVIELLNIYGIDDYFFLDSSFPMIKLMAESNENNIAVRFSEYEPLEMVNSVKNMVKWVWVDCFSRFPLDKSTFDHLKSMGLKICIVSPELQGQEERIIDYAGYMKENNIIPDAVCSKAHNFELWSKYIKFS
ncbi:hypothetical protein L4D08_06685 [Photobacterium chitinilyticum]|uniref:hypothetical protein n=1 Tax=Photobacterium chitinilyticum TaxID=2485123 RepID=UPI003D10203D